MRALILAAGVGRRLADSHPGPKCLLRFGGATLLERHLANLRAAGIDAVTVCVGFEAERVRAELARLAATGVSVVANPDYTLGSVVSLWAVRDHLDARTGALVMDADVLCGPDMLRRLCASPHGNCLLLDRDFETGDEPVKICVREGRIVEFRKRPDPKLVFDFCGESVGFFRFDGRMAARLAARIQTYRRTGRDAEPHEEAIRDLLLESPREFGIEDVTGMPWLEIDFPADLLRAERDVLPRLHA
jgi:choline kinase